MGLEIASVFYNVSEDGKEHYNIKFDDAYLEHYPHLKNLSHAMREIPIEQRKENSPVFKISQYKPNQKV